MKEWVPNTGVEPTAQAAGSETEVDNFDGWVTLSVAHERGLGGVLGLVSVLNSIDGLDLRRIDTDRPAGVTALKLYLRQPYPLHALLDEHPRVIDVDWPADGSEALALDVPDAFKVRLTVN